MNEESELMHVPALARMLDLTDAAVRDGIRRKVNWLPESTKRGRKHVWLRSDVRAWLRAFRDGEFQQSKPGRKRQTPPTLQSVG